MPKNADSYQFDTIFTIDARTNLFLEVMTDHFQLSDDRVFAEMQHLVQHLRRLLASKGVRYEDLRPPLSPNIRRGERAFVFDWAKSTTSFYGREAIHAILPLLNRDSTHSFLCGDWIETRGDFSEWLAHSPSATLDDALLRLGGRGDTLYFVYLNNLPRSTAERLDDHLSRSPAYLGCLDLDLASPIKACVSTLLVRDFIKHKMTIIRGHEDDRDDSEDVDLSLFEFASLGFTVRSVPQMLYGIFLSYKIKRPILPQERDTKFSLNAFTASPIGLHDFEVVLEESKLAYLRAHKAGSLKMAGLDGLSAKQIADQIRAKVEATYIYNLSRSPNGETLKLNILLEFSGAVRKECALEYLPSLRELRVITFY